MKDTMSKHHLLFIFFTFFFSPSISTNTITQTTSLRQGDTIISTGGTFKLGFFTAKSNRTYLGIWYANIPTQTVIWVANRENPLTNNTSGALQIDNNGRLILLASSGTTSGINTLWFPNSSKTKEPVIAEILDSGNFVLRFVDDYSSYLWQSFDYPTDTLLSGMKLGWNLNTGLRRYLHSWKSPDDPTLGDYMFKMNLQGSPEMFLYKKSSMIYRSGPWINFQFSGVPDLVSDDKLQFMFVENQSEVYYTYNVTDSSLASRFVLTPSGMLQRFVWLDDQKKWSVFWSDPKYDCDTYQKCGVYGVCNAGDSPICQCLLGFEPRSPAAWELRDPTDGCKRSVRLNCRDDGFQKLTGMKLPDTRNSTVNLSMSIDECQQWCLKDCSCAAFASANISGEGKGCIIWTTDLIDLQKFDIGGDDLYIRLARSQIHNTITSFTKKGSNKKKVVLATVLPVVSLVLFLLGLCGLCIWKRRKGINKMTTLPTSEEQSLKKLYAVNSWTDNSSDCSGEKDLELQLFDIDTIVAATGYFAEDNKLGEGGFGPVYKGKLRDGQDIAVKRLSKNSSQGLDEFKNEVRLIAKLQHRNLVRLLGCCIRGERILIYEFMHNGSLDLFLFDRSKSKLLSWERRFAIILGIARGLLYLHQDSRLRIIHRDLKASNVLLDIDMNPKISDFGMARIFGGDQADEHTRRVVGTYGYMAPEYAMDGLFSVKSDVFSFGVLILEIISGQKNKGVYQSEHHLNLLSHAWSLWNEGNCLQFVDESIHDSCQTSEVTRCIQVGLLCVQEQAKDRPTVSEIITMLSGENIPLPRPNMPGFSCHRFNENVQSASSTTINGVSITMFEGR